MRTALTIVGLALILAGCAGMRLGQVKDRRLDPGVRGPQLHAAP